MKVSPSRVMCTYTNYYVLMLFMIKDSQASKYFHSFSCHVCPTDGQFYDYDPVYDAAAITKVFLKCGIEASQLSNTCTYFFEYCCHSQIITIAMCYTFLIDEFRQTLEHTELNKFVKFNFDTDFVRLHFGAKRDRRISYSEFTQVLWVRLGSKFFMTFLIIRSCMHCLLTHGIMDFPFLLL